MCTHVVVPCRLDIECHGAEAALEFLLAVMQQQVVGQRGPAAECHGAQVALKRPLARMHDHVLVEVTTVASGIVALLAYPVVDGFCTLPHEAVLNLQND